MRALEGDTGKVGQPAGAAPIALCGWQLESASVPLRLNLLYFERRVLEAL